MKKTIPTSIAKTTTSRKKIDHPAASPPPSIMLTLQVEQAKIKLEKFILVKGVG